ncbi:hypothetical protein I6B53_07875 [Schaalia sp. 19OD2882]|uniref:hypothetical protein n=1 Tax=Schaalia sp. 19OD2882 TaxID=2794089 RepID=UPI001C1E8E9C|nr:hypothetical protein [Schaalia sp. 19OD2882]QWW19044.1 hypothetical protein I6B53_07875 [Schaalia sp. 19OD2882]
MARHMTAGRRAGKGRGQARRRPGQGGWRRRRRSLFPPQASPIEADAPGTSAFPAQRRARIDGGSWPFSPYEVPGLSAALRTHQHGSVARAIDMVDEILAEHGSEISPIAKIHVLKLLVDWHAEVGNEMEAKRRASRAVRVAMAELGPLHEITLVMRNSELYWMCVCGYEDLALNAFAQLLRDIRRAPEVPPGFEFVVRNNSAMPLKAKGLWERAARVYRDLVADMQGTVDQGDPMYLMTRNNLGEVLAMDRRFAESTAVYEGLMEDLLESHHCGDERILELRHLIALNHHEDGNVALAREQWSILVEDCRRHLGETHSLTGRQRMLQVGLALDDGDTWRAARWCRALVDNPPAGFGPEEIAHFTDLLDIVSGEGPAGEGGDAFGL